MLGSFKVGILQKGTFNIEIPDLLKFHNVLHEKDSMTGKKVVTFTALLNCKFGVLDSALCPGPT